MTYDGQLSANVVGRSGGEVTVAVAGEVDIITAPSLRECLDRCLEEGCTDVVLDMDDLKFMDSCGLAVVVAVMNRLRSRGGRLAVRNPPAIAQRVLSISGLLPYIEIIDPAPASDV